MVLLIPTDAFQGAGLANLAAAVIAGIFIAVELRRAPKPKPTMETT